MSKDPNVKKEGNCFVMEFPKKEWTRRETLFAVELGFDTKMISNRLVSERVVMTAEWMAIPIKPAHTTTHWRWEKTFEGVDNE